MEEWQDEIFGDLIGSLSLRESQPANEEELQLRVEEESREQEREQGLYGLEACQDDPIGEPLLDVISGVGEDSFGRAERREEVAEEGEQEGQEGGVELREEPPPHRFPIEVPGKRCD